MVTDKIKFIQPDDLTYIRPDDSVINYKSEDFFRNNSEQIHISAGAGLRVVMNENFIIAVDFGKAFKEQDGNTGLYIGLNYLF
jgi:hypothetical protein